MLAIALLSVNPTGLQLVWRFLVELRIEHHGMAAQHGTAETRRNPALTHCQSFNVEPILLRWDAQERPVMASNRGSMSFPSIGRKAGLMNDNDDCALGDTYNTLVRRQAGCNPACLLAKAL